MFNTQTSPFRISAVFRIGLIAACLVCGMLHTLHAFIVGGFEGEGNNNTEIADLQTFLANEHYTVFPYWENLIRVADASGVYLGYNLDTQTGWVVSATHVGTLGSIQIGGASYTVSSTKQIGNSDLTLISLDMHVSVPSLLAVALTETTASVGEFTLMFGRGYTNSSSSPFISENPGADDANRMRFATNFIFNLNDDEDNILITDFTDPNDTSSTSTAYEGQASTGDSGGGLFVYRNGKWSLAGITSDIETNGDDDAAYGDFTTYVDIFAYLNQINEITGVLIPEPGSLLLILSGFLLILRRNRQSRCPRMG